jgi:hypothetical protein
VLNVRQRIADSVLHLADGRLRLAFILPRAPFGGQLVISRRSPSGCLHGADALLELPFDLVPVWQIWHREVPVSVAPSGRPPSEDEHERTDADEQEYEPTTDTDLHAGTSFQLSERRPARNRVPRGDTSAAMRTVGFW